MSEIRDGLDGAIGNTPLIRLHALSEASGCTVLGKAEFLNPGGSVKDRAALAIVRAAERDGRLGPGGVIVEGTAGNTGIGLAHVALARGYRCVIVMPSNQSQEKIDLLRSLGAEVELVPPAPFRDPNNYYHVARRRAEATPGALWADQFENPANAQTHYETTGPELWRQAGGQIDGVVMAAGTGGTIGGVSAFLKEKNPALAAYLIDPAGSGLYAWVTRGEFASEGSSITEGIGIMRETANFRRARLDGAFRGSDREVVEMAHFVLRREGLFVGSSSALNCVGALRLARKLGPGKIIVTVLCDGGGRYQSRLFNPAWLEEKALTPKAKGLEFLED
ncbi:MAG TPA: cysteine synthase A [Polyangiaceae bacterium]|nr:cysteine synthase A [Polyangiaceae bacterium]